MEYQLVWMGWQSIRIVGVSVCVIFIFHQKMQKKQVRVNAWSFVQHVLIKKWLPHWLW